MPIVGLKEDNPDAAKIWDNVWKNRDFVLGRWKNIGNIDDRYDIHWDRPHYNLIEDLVKSVSPSGRFLEAGCGTGQWAFVAASRFSMDATGVDIAEETLNRLKGYVEAEGIDRVSFIVDDLNQTKLPEASFDCFVSLGVIEHFRNPAPMIASLHKVLKPGGKGLITVPNLFSMQTITRPILQMIGKWFIGFERSYSGRSLNRVCTNAGFKIVHQGIVPTGELFGTTINNTVPCAAKAGLAIEQNQSIFGFLRYVIIEK